MTENEHFGLVFKKTGSINSGTVNFEVCLNRKNLSRVPLFYRNICCGQECKFDENFHIFLYSICFYDSYRTIPMQSESATYLAYILS